MALKDKPTPTPAASSKPPEAAVPPANGTTNSANNEPKTLPPEQEAHSHKPTFGESAEKPERTEPEGDPTLREDAKIDLAVRKLEANFTPLSSQETLDKRVEAQANQLNPDQVQKDGDWPSTEGQLASPAHRPHTIDPETGHVVYKGEAAELPGGNVQHEGEGGG